MQAKQGTQKKIGKLCLEHCTGCLRDLDFKKIGAKIFESFKMWWWRRTEEIERSGEVTNEEMLGCTGEKRTPINNILRRKANWVGHILIKN